MLRGLMAVLTVLLLGLQYRLWFGQGSVVQLYNTEQIITQQHLANEKLKERNQTLAAEVINLQHGLEGVEDVAREELGMIKRGETFYLVTP